MADTYTKWLLGVRSLFPQPEEYQWARVAYDFIDDYNHGLSPLEAYERFDESVAAFVSEDA